MTNHLSIFPSLRHEPSRGSNGKAASRQAARRVELPGWGKSSNITEDFHNCAAEQAISEMAALHRGMEKKSKEFVDKGAGVYAKA